MKTIIINETDKETFCKKRDKINLCDWYTESPMQVIVVKNEIHYIQMFINDKC